MTYKIFADSFHHFLRVAINTPDSIYAFKLFDLQKQSRITGLYTAQIQRVMPTLNSVWVKFNKDDIGFLKSPKRSYIEGEWIAIEVLKDQDEEKKYLVKERSDIKIETKSTILKEPHDPFYRLCETLRLDQIESILCSSDVFQFVQDILRNSSLVSKLALHKDQNLFQDYDLDTFFDQACCEEVPLKNLGSLLIEEGRTLTSIDLNMKGAGGESTFERAALDFNLKACDFIWEQIRHRNLGGLILIDFLRMQESEHRHKIFQRMKDLLKKDKVKSDVLGFTKAGLFEISRYSDRQSLKSVLGDLWNKI